MSDLTEQMRADWNQRAIEDAHYFVAFGSRNQDETGFAETGASVVRMVEAELKRLPRGANRRAWRALEIGCGPGRLMKPLSPHFGEIHGVDVSGEMIRLAHERLQAIPHAHVHATNGASLDAFADDSFDLIYSYAVFQHIPSRDVVLEYMREIRRALKPGGIFRGQFNSLPPALAPNNVPNTWWGVSFSPADVREFTSSNGLDLLALEGGGTQYMWTTWRKPPVTSDEPSIGTSIRRITNAFSSEPATPNLGSTAAISLWIVGLPGRCDLNSIEVHVDDCVAVPVFLGPQDLDGLSQLNVMLPHGTRTGLVPVELCVRGMALCAPDRIRVIPSGPLVPRILSLTDGVNLVEEKRCTSGLVKLHLDEVTYPELLSADIGGLPVRGFETFCTDPLSPRYEVNFRLPDGLESGRHHVRVRIGSRPLMPQEIEVTPEAVQS